MASVESEYIVDFVSMKLSRADGLARGVSDLVLRLCAMHTGDNDCAERFRIAAHEMAENMIRYGGGDGVQFDAEVFRWAGETCCRLRTRNSATAERLRLVEALLERLVQSDDAVDVYDELIEETASRSEGSGLGLARITCESALALRYEISGSELVVTAEGPLS